LGNNTYYDKFSNQVKVANVTGIHWAGINCLNWVIENFKEFKAHKGINYGDLKKDAQAQVCEKTEQLYHGYIMTHHSAKSNDKFKMDLYNNFTVGTNNYPKSPQESLRLLDQYLKQADVQAMQPQGHSFAQGGHGLGRGRGGGRG
jgi:hypothetical protein